MLFNSYQFIFAFLPIALVGCWLLARWKGAGAAQLWLIASSFFFYACWNPAYLPLLLGSILFNYMIAVLMVRTDVQKRRQMLLALAVVVNLGLLAYYKYTNYALSTANHLAGTNFRIEDILLPLGISFYTFQQLTLLIDISAGTVHKFRLRDFSLFVVFFPHLIAGPIVHHREMMPQFEKAEYKFKWENFAPGLALFAVGLFKKVVLADGIAEFVSPLYAQAAAGEKLTAFYAWAAAFGYTLQLYFDFSGYSEMALGLALFFGIKLPMNFNSPLRATSMIDFWSRWHITLTRFLTAYVYNPISMALMRRRMKQGKKGIAGAKTTIPAYLQIILVPTVITMFLSGLWHGAGDQFLVWGLLHGAFLAINHAWRLVRPRFWKDNVSYDRVAKPAGWALTLLCVVVTMVFFRASSVESAMNVIGGFFFLNGAVLPVALAEQSPALAGVLSALNIGFAPLPLDGLVKIWMWIVPLLAIAVLSPNVLEIMRKYQPAITMPGETAAGRVDFFGKIARKLSWAPSSAWAVTAAGLAVVSVFSLFRVSEFLYWNF